MYEAVESYILGVVLLEFVLITDTKDLLIDAYSRKCGIWAFWGQGKNSMFSLLTSL